VAYEHGASVFRVHEVAPVHDALLVAAATVSRRWPTTNSAKATR
jgi:dihydropteroate synthase